MNRLFRSILALIARPLLKEVIAHLETRADCAVEEANRHLRVFEWTHFSFHNGVASGLRTAVSALRQEVERG